MTSYTAKAFREEGWWGVQLIERPNILTQTRRLDQIPDMVRDALKLFPEIEPHPETVTINVVVVGEIESQVAKTLELRNRAAKAQEEATASMRSTAKALHDQGLTYRDVGQLLGVTHQTAKNLATA
ncbi:transcriptional regulator [Corynebacterium pseudotuberculosis]|uniref:hypothetical protein n=1 Tax=Corynebacterium pseudotuberculosis TaxID=1719 RepID=UPI0006566946|nr:hypothetical protein [Corynebacterium pseudotuberculosis]AKN59746.1 transcriptional regulator [Corynebacterium pseudotuberculosis 31]APB11488.1 transcriptional regulator [Corynebacterium pseudotuberculosis]APB13532.1 transcriptional regulator [Corynebacterium pseudotuberculosis]APB15575.1 transcriptional regulator [Corynebacterium pseudotuberculosis]APB17620.1 transcriptional regulator [Corynebacterium pseudotuberculosis]